MFCSDEKVNHGVERNSKLKGKHWAWVLKYPETVAFPDEEKIPARLLYK